MSPCAHVLAAHGTRSPVGIATLRALAAAVPLPDVHLAFVDVCPPSLATVLAELNGPAIVVPALLSTGFHVTVDIPSVVDASTRVARHLGPDRLLSVALAARLRTSLPVALIGAGSSHPAGLAELAQAAADLSVHLGRAVHPLTVSSTLEASLAALGEVEVAPYLLAEGFFADRVAAAAGPRPCSAVIGVQESVVELIVRRFADAA